MITRRLTNATSSVRALIAVAWHKTEVTPLRYCSLVLSHRYTLQDPQVDDNGQVVFKSNLFGSLGAGMFVAPNMIDFGTIFQNVDQKILANLAVFIVVITLIVLYVPSMVVCHRQDKLDMNKVSWGVLLRELKISVIDYLHTCTLCSVISPLLVIPHLFQ